MAKTSATQAFLDDNLCKTNKFHFVDYGEVELLCSTDKHVWADSFSVLSAEDLKIQPNFF
jgi:hypothetical protein